MATRYVKAAGGNWSSTSTWSATGSGGGDSASVPTSGNSDDVIIQAGSGNLTIDAGATRTCRSFVVEAGYTGTVTMNVSLTVGTSTAPPGNVAFKLISGMNWTFSAGTLTLSTNSLSSTTLDVDFAGKSFGAVSFTTASTSGYRFVNGSAQDPFLTVASGNTLTHSQGGLNFNSVNASIGILTSSGTQVRSITLGSSTITLTRSGTTALTLSGSNLTFSPGTSTIIMTGSITTINSNQTFNNVILNNNTLTITGTSSPTFANLTRNGNAPGAKDDTLILGVDIIVTGLLTLAGSSTTNRLWTLSDVPGTARTITAASVSLANVDFQDITAAGAAAPFSGTSLGDTLGNTNITFTVNSGTSNGLGGVYRYWVADVNNSLASNTSSWSTTDGGASGASCPLAQDTVVFTDNSFSVNGRNGIQFDLAHFCRNLDMSGLTRTFSIARPSAGFDCHFYGDIDMNRITAIGTTNWASCVMAGRGSHTVKGPTTFSQTWRVETAGGTYSAANNITADANSTLNLVNGSYNGAGFTHTFGIVSSGSGSLTRSLTLGTGLWSCVNTGPGTVWNFAGTTGVTLDATGSTISAGANSTSGKTFNGGGLTYNNWVIPTGGTGIITVVGNNTFSDISMSGTGTKTIQFTAGSTQTLTGGEGAFISGVSGGVITMASTSAGNAWTIASAGRIVSDYISLQDSTASGGVPFYAGANSTNVSGNTNWVFTAAPALSSGGTFLMMGI